MALPSTSNSTLLFSSTQPAWERGVELVQGHQTRLFTSRSGLEQRQQGRIRSQCGLSFYAYFSQADAPERDERMRAELVSPVVVPFWTEEARVVSMTSTSVTITRAATIDWFAAGDYIYLWDGLNGQFRMVTGQGATDQILTLEAVGAPVIFGANSAVYPCRICVRTAGLVEYREDSDFAVEEDVRYTTL